MPIITPDALQLLFGGGLVAVLGALRSLVRGRKEDQSLQADIQEKVTKMAEHWLEKAETRLADTENRLTATEKRATDAERRLARAESRAAGAEAYAGQADRRANQLRREFNAYREDTALEKARTEEHLRVVHSWIESGAKPPPPSWPKWLPLVGGSTINENED